MNITATKERLVHAIQIAERLVGKKESLPVLSCIVLEASEGLSIRTTNLEAGIEVRVPCEVAERGVVAIPAKILSQTIRAITSDKVSLVVEDGNLVVSARGTKTLLKAIPHDEFPQLGEGAGSEGVEVAREKLLNGLRAVSYAASPSMIRPELGSVLVSFKESGLVCVATDSFRLAEKTITGVIAEDAGDVLIPLKHVGELTHLLEKVPAEKVRINTADSQLTAETEGIRFFSRIIDGTFPNYKDIIPKDTRAEVTLLKSDFVETLRKARVFAGADQQIGLHVYPSKKLFSATAQSAMVGEMSDELDAAVSGEEIDINFHIGYLSDCLGAIESDSITLKFSGIGRPLVIRGVGDTSFLYLVMPMNR